MPLAEVLAGKPGHEGDIRRLTTLTATWKVWVFESVRVVYAVRATNEAFPDERFGGLVSKSQRDFAWQRERIGDVVHKAGNFSATQSIVPSAIVAKATLSDLPIEKL